MLLALAPTASAARGGVPSDRAFPAQWQLATDAPMGARSAWRLARTGAVTVAVIDTGARLRHPDLAPNLWTNPGEVAGNDVDDDGNGHVDDVHGVDLVAGDGDPADEHGHGTHVAGIIGARGDNRVGTAGVAWRARLMIVRALGRDGSGRSSDVAAGIRYAVAHGARIINLSMAGPDDDPDLAAAVEEAGAAGALVVAAAGNTGDDLDRVPAFPAALPSEAVVAVAASASGGALAPGSSFGKHAVDLTAPGEDVTATALDGLLETRSGTSQAAAHVSGVLALMAAARPSASLAELRSALLLGARPSRLAVAAGALDAAGSLRALLGRSAARKARARG
jgi:subtilisin family serine protease